MQKQKSQATRPQRRGSETVAAAWAARPPVATDAADSVERALAAIRAGQMVVVADDDSRENEGDLIIAAEHVTEVAINFMATHGRGLICIALPRERLQPWASAACRSRAPTADSRPHSWIPSTPPGV